METWPARLNDQPDVGLAGISPPGLAVRTGRSGGDLGLECREVDVVGQIFPTVEIVSMGVDPAMSEGPNPGVDFW